MGFTRLHHVSPLRKLYSTVSKSTTIPGRKNGLLMFVYHSRSVSVCERTDNVSCLREQCVQRYANTYVDRQEGKTIKTLGPSDLIGRIFLLLPLHRINKDKCI